MKIGPDDPSLTAYALGELDEAERKAVEAQLAECEESRRLVEELRQTGDALRDELKKETSPGLAAANRQAVESRLKQPVVLRSGVDKARRRPRWKRLSFLMPAAAALLLLGAMAYVAYDEYAEPARPESCGDSVELPLTAGCDSDKYTDDDSGQLRAGLVSGHGELNELDALRCQIVDVNAATALARGRQPAAPGWLGPLPDDSPGDYDGHNTEAYDQVVHNPFIRVTDDHNSTFSIDVDTASYANLRRFLKQQGQLPPPGAVRLEEMINYFTYDCAPPTGEHPFAVHIEVGSCPWKTEHRLLRIGLKGKEISQEERPPCNLVFLLDVSGSMQPANKLPLVKAALKLLVENLRQDDRVAIAVYASASGLVLPSTTGANKQAILEALGRLHAGGSTNGGAGIQLAYNVAREHFLTGGINRVLLATDGDFNVGVTNQDELVRLIQNSAKSGIFLSVLGFGRGNYKDSTMEKLADKGNGNYAYIDTLSEARKVLVEQVGGTLVTIAKDVKIQLDFNHLQVEAFRLLGYENRVLRHEDFRDDTKDAGEIGAGHTVTALYELVPKGVEIELPEVEPSKYQDTPQPSDAAHSDELLTIRLRYKLPDKDTSEAELEYAVIDSETGLADTSDDFRFAAAVAAFGMILRDSPYKGGATFDTAIELGDEAKGPDPNGYRAEFIQLVKLAKAIKGQ